MFEVVSKLLTKLSGNKANHKIYHACKDLNNFGDMVGPYIYEKLTGKSHQFLWGIDKEAHLMICGSILREATDYSTVLGCGLGTYEQEPVGKPKILAIRGYRTEKKLLELGYKNTWAIGDPALCLPFLYYPEVTPKFELGIIPHYIDLEIAEKHLKNNNLTNYKVIDICQDVEKVIDDVLSCKKTISSSLHGLIVSHAYNIPSQWVEFSDNVVGGGFKFRDYFTTVPPNQKPIDCRSEIPDNIVDMIPEITINIDDFYPVLECIKENIM